MQLVLENYEGSETTDSREEDQESQKNVECRCDAFTSKNRILLRSIKFVELPGVSPCAARQFDMTYCVVELSPGEAAELALKLMAMSSNV